MKSVEKPLTSLFKYIPYTLAMNDISLFFVLISWYFQSMTQATLRDASVYCPSVSLSVFLLVYHISNWVSDAVRLLFECHIHTLLREYYSLEISLISLINITEAMKQFFDDFFVSPAKHIGITLSALWLFFCLSVCPSVCLSGSHTFMVFTHSYVSQATHAFLGMLQLCFPHTSSFLKNVVKLHSFLTFYKNVLNMGIS